MKATVRDRIGLHEAADKQVTLLSLLLFIPNSCQGYQSPHLPASVGKERHVTDNPAAVRCSAGIDVSKDALDIFIDSFAEEYRVANQAGDIAALVEQLKAGAPDYIVVEASGGFESEVVTALASAGLPVCRVSPQRVRFFARALGELAKTGRLDARQQARYGRDCRPPLSRPTAHGGREACGAHRPLHGDAGGGALQPGAAAVLRAAEEGA